MQQLEPQTLTEGERRLAYFFIHGLDAVLCPVCAWDAPAHGKLRAVYTASRLYRCGHCLVWIGPANATEQEDA